MQFRLNWVPSSCFHCLSVYTAALQPQNHSFFLFSFFCHWDGTGLSLASSATLTAPRLLHLYFELWVWLEVATVLHLVQTGH